MKTKVFHSKACESLLLIMAVHP